MKKLENSSANNYAILSVLLSGVFSNLFYGLIGGPENTFSIAVVVFVFILILVNFNKIKINHKLSIFFIFICFGYIVALFEVEWSEIENMGVMHGAQVCLKLIIFSYIVTEINKLGHEEIKYTFLLFSKTVVAVTIITLPIYIFSDYGLIALKERFISMDEGNSQRFGGFGFETLDYAYSALVGVFVFLYSKIKLRLKIIYIAILCCGVFFTKSNFISIALIGALFYALIKRSGNKILIMTIFTLIVVLIVSYAELYDLNLIQLIFLRAADVEIGTSLGERILPGLNLFKYYIENSRYFGMPAPGIAVSDAIIKSDEYITFNAWGIAKILSDFGFFGIIIVVYIFYLMKKMLFKDKFVAIFDWIFVISVIYIFAQAGYANFTAVTLLILSNKLFVLERER